MTSECHAMHGLGFQTERKESKVIAMSLLFPSDGDTVYVSSSLKLLLSVTFLPWWSVTNLEL